MENEKKIYPGAGKKKWPGQNKANKALCWVQRHSHIKWCREYLKAHESLRLMRIQNASEARTKMHKKRNDIRRGKKAAKQMFSSQK